MKGSRKGRAGSRSGKSNPKSGPRLKRKVPVVRQGYLQCSEASAAAVLSYHGKKTDATQFMDFAADVLGIRDDKAEIVAFENMVPAMRKAGLRVSNIKKGNRIDDLKRQIRLQRPVLVRLYVPVLLFGRFLHTVVVTGFEGDKIIIMDPEENHYRKIPFKEFDEWWAQEDRAAIFVYGRKKEKKKGSKT